MKNKMKWLLIASMCLGVLGGCASNEESTQIVEMTTNDMVQPLGIDETPYFSWKMKDSKEGQKQSAYQIMVGETKEDLENSNFVWDTGKVLSDESVGILYDGDELEAEKDYFWQIRVWDKEEKEILSDVSRFEMGKISSVWNNTEWITSFKESYESEGASSEQAEIIGKIEYNFKMEQMATGFVWGAKDGQYGKHYKLSFNVADGQIEMTLARMEKEKLQDEETIVVLEDDATEFLENEHRVCMNVEENRASVSVDDKLVLQDVELQDLAIGEIGFWVDRSENKAWYDNICVLNSEGQTVYWEDFEQEKNIFSPYYLKVEDGWARADSGFVITPGAEIPAPMFRKEFETEKNKKIEDCRLYISAMGIYDVYLNEKKAGLCPHEENKISSKEMILKIFETKECDVSFCDKLFHKSLLESIRFPVGEINEDEAIIFSVVCDLDFVSLVNKPFYNYNHRENSITTSEFNNKKMVVLKNARNTLKITTNKFPDIEIQAKRYFSKKVFALLSMIAFSSKNTRKEFKGAYKELLNEIKTNKKILSRADKLRYLLLKTKTYRLVKSILK